MKDFQQRIERLSPAKRAILEQGLLAAARRRAAAGRVAKRPADAPPVLSYAEQRLWFLDQLLPGHPRYNVPVAVRLTGPLDESALEKALAGLVARHETLRTTYPADQGEPRRAIAARGELPLARVEIGDPDEESRSLRLQVLLREEARRPFDLARGPLARATLFRLGADRRVVLLTMHHIVCDGWSMDVILRELAALYEAALRGRPDPLPPLAIQYADYAAWQRERLVGDALERLLDYWKELLDPPPEALQLPTDRPRPATVGCDGALEPFSWSGDLSARVRRLAGDLGTTPFAVVLAALKVLLARICRARDVTVGTAVAGRTRPETEGLIGFFVNTLVVRSDLREEVTFADFARRVHRRLLEALQRQELPFERLVELVAPERRRDHDPLFQVALVYQNAPLRLPTASGLKIEPLVVDPGTAKHDLTLYCWEEEGRLTGHAEYRTALFDQASMRRLLEALETLLGEAVTDPACPVAQLPLMPRHTRDCVLLEFSQSDSIAASPCCLHELLESRAASDPEHPAVRFGGKEMTYAALNGRANRIARCLRSRGVGAEQLVAVALPRSCDLVAVLLGTLKAGAAYVPLDPVQPPARLAMLLTDAQPALLIAADGLLSRVGTGEVRALSLEQIEQESQVLSDRPRDWPVDPAQLAYCIYTSGSTGRPKGVLVEHHSAVNFIRAQGRVLGISPKDRYLQFFAPTFDGSIAEIFGALASGACLLIAEPETCVAADALEELIRREGATVAQLTPSMLQALNPAALPGLATVVSAGEAITPELVGRWAPGRRLFNAYGPTETSVGACMARLDEPAALRPPLGRPLEGVRVYVLDDRLQPVPPGFPGEICIGGAGVARGYLHLPELTAERFVSDPLSGMPHARMYRSGDLGRWRDDGMLEFLGRVDEQVKIRGFRVEPGEVAAVLEALPAVKQAAVVTHEERGGEQQLVAYVVPCRGPDAGPAEKAAMEDEHLNYWRTLSDAALRQTPPPADPTLHVAGWVSSRTGRPLAHEPVREWAEALAQRVLALRPRRVLEIGCKTGLVLFRAAPHCASYVATDLSGETVRWLRGAVDRRQELHGRVEVLERPADRFDGLRPASFDTVLLTCVVQTFPGIDYLFRVLRGLQPLVAPGGRVVLSDLRSLPLQPACAASIEAGLADDVMTREEFRQRVTGRLEREQELLIHPDLFAGLPSHLARVASVDLPLKRGPAESELVQYRYDAVVCFDAPSREPTAEALDFDEDRLDVDGIASRLRAARPRALRLRGVENARLVRDLALRRLLDDSSGPGTVAELKAAADEAQKTTAAVDPEALWQLGDTLGYDVKITWSGSGEDGRFDATLIDRGQIRDRRPRPGRSRRRAAAAHRAAARAKRRARRTPAQPLSLRNGGGLANDPLAGLVSRRTVALLRETLRERLPEYMIPPRFVLLSELPRTPHGKLDRRALPAPAAMRAEWSAGYVTPRNDEEALVAEIWERLLGISPVGASDNFFDLGGHSMLAVRMIAAIERRTGRRLPLAALFQQPTVEHLARLLREPEVCPPESSLVLMQPQGNGLPFFCVHPAGGTVFCYQALAEHLGRSRPFYGLQAVGLDGGRPPHENVEQMAAHYAAAMRAVQSHGPYHLGGWSLGGNLAFEVARQLHAAGEPVGLLALFDSGALPPDRDPTEEDFLPVVMALFPGDDDLSLEQLRAMTPEEHLVYFSRRALKAGVVLPTFNVETAGHVFEVFKGNLKAMWEFRPRPFPGKVTLLASEEQPEGIDVARDPCLGWGAYAQGGVEVHRIPGRHLDIIREPHVRVLAGRLRECLDRAAAVESGRAPSLASPTP